MRIVTLGDVVLDVIVDVPDGLNEDDDAEASITLAAGGQAANVATWAAALGATASVIGPLGPSDAAALITKRLADKGVEHFGIPVGRDGTVVSLVTRGTRTLISDAGDQTWLSAASPDLLSADLDWLHLSGYPLLRAADPLVVTPLAAQARSLGARVSVDLSSTALLTAFGRERFQAFLSALAPDVLFANEAEWEALGWASSLSFDVVLKLGPLGAQVTADGKRTAYPAQSVEAIDATGAGDALAAGYLVGGPDLAMATAARCVQMMGAQPQGD